MTHPATPGFGLIIIGDEIMSGKRADKHLPKVIELLKARVPADCRAWDPDRKRWWISIEYEGVILRLFPAFRAYLDQEAMF